MVNINFKRRCRLCGTELTSNNKCDSHIIPRFLWKEYMGADDNRQNMILVRGSNTKILKSYGITDNSILCRQCDGKILGKYENDFREVWSRVFLNGQFYPVSREGKLFGWAKEVNGREDIIKTKLFILCCLWRASVSCLDDYPIKLSPRRENAIRNELLREKHDRLLYQCHMTCLRFEDGALGFAPTPYYTRKNSSRTKLCYIYLPNGYLFAVRPGIDKNNRKIQAYEFGAEKQYFFIGNCGHFENSKAESKLFKEILPALQGMYNSDKNEIKFNLLKGYGDLSANDVDKVFLL